MAFVARCSSLAFSSLFLHVLTHGFDFTCAQLIICNLSSVLTLLKATYASPGLNLPFACVISVTISEQCEALTFVYCDSTKQVLMETES